MFAHAFSVLAWAAADQAVSSLEYGVIAAGTVVVVATAATTPANTFSRGGRSAFKAWWRLPSCRGLSDTRLRWQSGPPPTRHRH
jgi:hypothetical protein